MNAYAYPNKILCFGEMLLRLSPPGTERVEQASDLQVYFDGAEAMAALSLAYQGANVAYMTILPEHRIGKRALMTLSGAGIDVSRIKRKPGRMGLFYFERGSGDRISHVIYDRENTPFAQIKRDDLDWDNILNGVSTFYFTGVALAISEDLRLGIEDALKACKGRGIKTICDLNYRSRMWDRSTAHDTWVRLLPYVDVCVGCDEDIWRIFPKPGINPNRATTFGHLEYYRDTALEISDDFGCSTVAIEVRSMGSNGLGRWRGMLIEGGQTYMSDTRDVMNNEHSGCGDSFAAGVALGITEDWEPSTIINYALLSSVLKATIPGSINYLSRDEIVAAAGSSLTMVDY